MWIVAWKLANWSLRTHCYKGGHPSVRRTESLKLWKKPPLFLQRNLEDADILLCSDPAIEEQLFWLHHLGCSTGCRPEPSSISVRDAALLQQQQGWRVSELPTDFNTQRSLCIERDFTAWAHRLKMQFPSARWLHKFMLISKIWSG